MRACVQRVSRAKVTVAGEVTGEIGKGLLVLLGVAAEDDDADIKFLSEKIVGLRIFEDENDKMNLSVKEVGGGILVVSQFTLFGDCRKGRRPSFIAAAPPEKADDTYQRFVAAIRDLGVIAETGKFREHMDVELVNDGPVTLLLDSTKLF